MERKGLVNLTKHEQNDFFDYTRRFIDEEVQVVTVEGTYNGKLIAIERDFLLLGLSTRGTNGVFAIRFEKMIGITKYDHQSRRRQPFLFGFGHHRSSEKVEVKEEASSSSEE